MMQSLYTNFIGIDIGKSEFVSFLKSDDKTKCYKNNRSGFQKFLSDHKDNLAHSLVVLETTGGYENACLDFLLDNNFAVHWADARKVKNFTAVPEQKIDLMNSDPERGAWNFFS